jgi:hypothetical protein
MKISNKDIGKVCIIGWEDAPDEEALYLGKNQFSSPSFLIKKGWRDGGKIISVDSLSQIKKIGKKIF